MLYYILIKSTTADSETFRLRVTNEIQNLDDNYITFLLADSFKCFPFLGRIQSTSLITPLGRVIT